MHSREPDAPPARTSTTTTHRHGSAAPPDAFSHDGLVGSRRGDIVLSDPAMLELHRMIDRVAPAGVNVLVLGETGVGKDVVASLIHERSPRHDRPFVKLNCATLCESLLETELFGHERGAFTGATAAKKGLLETADGGTVLLDEVGELPLTVQAKLLRAIEAREVIRVGALRSQAIDVRFVAATNRDLEEEARRGTFRLDLFYRLETVQLRVPALRERRAEILPLARQFLRQACQQFDLGPRSLSETACEALLANPWPGNIRQLRNLIERAALLGRTPLIDRADLGLPVEPGQHEARPGFTTPPSDGEEDGELTEHALANEQVLERGRIITALAQCAGNQSRAATVLGMSRRTLVRKLGQYRLPRPRRSPRRGAPGGSRS
jgi:two-component system response regulator AtoC